MIWCALSTEGHCPQIEVPNLQHRTEIIAISFDLHIQLFVITCPPPPCLLFYKYVGSLTNSLSPHQHLKCFPLYVGYISPIVHPLGPLLLIPQHPTENDLLPDTFHSIYLLSTHGTFLIFCQKCWPPKYYKELFTWLIPSFNTTGSFSGSWTLSCVSLCSYWVAWDQPYVGI